MPDSAWADEGVSDGDLPAARRTANVNLRTVPALTLASERRPSRRSDRGAEGARGEVRFVVTALAVAVAPIRGAPAGPARKAFHRGDVAHNEKSPSSNNA